MKDPSTFGRRSVMTRVLTGTTGDPETAGAPAEGFTQAEQKYEVAGMIGRGGMGEVLLVEDKDLRRQIAMKVLRGDFTPTPQMLLKFVAEAQATSQLEHPGIPPVHDIGIQPSGQVYFTMKLVRGRTLGEVLKDLFLGVKQVRREYTLHRLVSILERICEAVHFAHEKGVIHRDLKPDNVMLGEYGEVHVMDWGIAKIASDAPETVDDFDEDAVRTSSSGGKATVVGAIKGTIPYMSPEQARGSASLDERSDIYALGCLLYEMLTLHPAFAGEDVSILLRVREGKCPPVTERNPRRPVPEALAALCGQAMSVDPAERPQTARAFADALRSWLDGRAEKDRRHAEAERLAAEGQQAAARHRELTRRVAEAEREAAAEEGKFKPWQPVAEKRPAIEARKRVDELNAEAALAFAGTTRLLDAALLAEEHNATARTALADLWRQPLEKAEAENHRPQTVYATAMIRRYDDGRLTAYLQGDGGLDLTSDPPGADVELFRFEERDGVLTPTDGRSLGRTPIEPISLPMGSYLCILRREGFPDVRYPIHIARGRAWKGSVRLLGEDRIGDGFVHVPAGPFVFGDGHHRCVRTLQDFAIRRFPVTFAEYGAFLAAIDAEHGAEEAQQFVPRTQGSGLLMARADEGSYAAVEEGLPPPVRMRYAREFGEDFVDRMPVFAVTVEDARAYCAWKTRTTDHVWRLPTEEEREKAARGVDGRRFPWGSLADPSLCMNRHGRELVLQPEPVGTFATATSVYGMGDAAGNVWDWTDSPFDPHVADWGARVVRGGCWFYPLELAQAAFRLGFDPAIRYPYVGFRPVHSIPVR